jgi:hypothetical protein
MARTAERRSEDVPTRLLLLEGDADRTDTQLTEMNDRIGKMLWAMVGILISTTTAAVLLALNLAVGRG